VESGNQSMLVANVVDSASYSPDNRALTHTSSDPMTSLTIGSTPSVEDDLVLVATINETPGGTKKLLAIEMKSGSQLQAPVVPDGSASAAGSSLYSPTSPFDDADTISFERPCRGLLGVRGATPAAGGQLEFGPEVWRRER